MRPPDFVWNRAAEAWSPDSRTGFRPGDVALSGLLAFHSVAMNGGVLHALEAADDQMLREAAEGYRYFGFGGVAALVESGYVRLRGEENVALSDAEELERQRDRAYSEAIPSDQALGDAFKRHFAAQPDQYARLDRSGGANRDPSVEKLAHHPVDRRCSVLGYRMLSHPPGVPPAWRGSGAARGGD